MPVVETPLCSRCDHAFSCSYTNPPDLDLFRSAYVPSPSECQAIYNELVALDASIVVVDTEMAQIRARLDALQHVQRQLVHTRAAKQSLKSRIRRLPNELLELIVRAALPPEWSTAPCGTVRLPLAQTCHRLRAAVHAMSDLWSTLVVPGYYESERDRQTFIASAPHYLKRAGSRPIDVVVPNFQNYSSRAQSGVHDPDEWLAAQMERLSAQMHRFRSIDWRYSIPALRSGAAVVAPLLQSARWATSERHGVSYMFTPHVTLDAPCLQSLLLSGLLPPSRVSVNWSGLSNLTLELPDFGQEDLLVMASCVALTSLHLLVFYEPTIKETNAAPTISLNALRELTAMDYGNSLCKFISAPNLVTLSTSCSRRMTASDAIYLATCVRSLLQRTVCPEGHPLQNMTLGTSPTYSDGVYHGLLSVLSCAPNLKHLELLYNHNANHCGIVIRGLILESSSATLVPMLDDIEIVLGRAYRAEDAKLVKLLAQSRWADGDEQPRKRVEVLARCGGFCGCISDGLNGGLEMRDGARPEKRRCTLTGLCVVECLYY